MRVCIIISLESGMASMVNTQLYQSERVIMCHFLGDHEDRLELNREVCAEANLGRVYTYPDVEVRRGYG